MSLNFLHAMPVIVIFFLFASSSNNKLNENYVLNDRVRLDSVH